MTIFCVRHYGEKEAFPQWDTQFTEFFPLDVWKIQAPPRHALEHSDTNTSDSEGSRPGRCSFLTRFDMSNRTSTHSLGSLVANNERHREKYGNAAFLITMRLFEKWQSNLLRVTSTFMPIRTSESQIPITCAKSSIYVGLHCDMVLADTDWDFGLFVACGLVVRSPCPSFL